MLKIRLKRVGRIHTPSFRVVVVESSRGSKAGRYVEMLGSYDPRRNAEAVINAERARHWLAHGAQASDTVHNLLVTHGVIEGSKRNALPKKRPPHIPKPVGGARTESLPPESGSVGAADGDGETTMSPSEPENAVLSGE